jgi:hypothetical protein
MRDDWSICLGSLIQIVTFYLQQIYIKSACTFFNFMALSFFSVDSGVLLHFDVRITDQASTQFLNFSTSVSLLVDGMSIPFKNSTR